MLRRIKREIAASSGNVDTRSSRNNVEPTAGVDTRSSRNNVEPTAGPSETRRGHESVPPESVSPVSVAERRVLRSRYNAVKNLISDNRDEISKIDSDKFASIIGEVESLHNLVQKPREQVADAEALLDITTTLVSSVKAHGGEGVSPADFVACLLRQFGQSNTPLTNIEESRISINWKDLGAAASHIFQRAPGCSTMVGPMNNEVKQRKVSTRRRHVNVVTERTRPEELHTSSVEEKTDTDRNMLSMFDILKKKGKIKLENLILNRTSFAQTVENLFALSFLVKDGRVEISVDNKGHFVSPRNAPHASAVASGSVSYNHFVFRFDYKDWKVMREAVKEGEEEMKQRRGVAAVEAEGGIRTPIRKLCRNRGLVLQQDQAAAAPEEREDITETAVAPAPPPVDHKPVILPRKGKRKL